MIIRIKKENDASLNAITKTHTLLNELRKHQDSMFINTNTFYVDGFTLWDVPAYFPLKNVINKELILTNSYQPILKRFHIRNIMYSLPLNNNIFISGKNIPMLREYYREKFGWIIELKKIEEFTSIDAYQLKKKG
jgi:hypothetical protein